MTLVVRKLVWMIQKKRKAENIFNLSFKCTVVIWGLRSSLEEGLNLGRKLLGYKMSFQKSKIEILNLFHLFVPLCMKKYWVTLYKKYYKNNWFSTALLTLCKTLHFCVELVAFASFILKMTPTLFLWLQKCHLCFSYFPYPYLHSIFKCELVFCFHV